MPEYAENGSSIQRLQECDRHKKGAVAKRSSPKNVILSERSESKDLRTNDTFAVKIGAKILRLLLKIFDFIQSLRLTCCFGLVAMHFATSPREAYFTGI